MCKVVLASARVLFAMILVGGWFTLQAHIIPEGRMTGGGSFFSSDGMRVTHGFELHCNLSAGPNNLEVNWGPGEHFHLETLAGVVCVDGGIDPAPPNAPFSTYFGHGFGLYNGVPGYQLDWVFVDAGEPGTEDVARITVTAPGGVVIMDAGASTLTFGNHQAHKESGQQEETRQGSRK